jgi:hypothetical protein
VRRGRGHGAGVRGGFAGSVSWLADLGDGPRVMNSMCVYLYIYIYI